MWQERVLFTTGLAHTRHSFFRITFSVAGHVKYGILFIDTLHIGLFMLTSNKPYMSFHYYYNLILTYDILYYIKFTIRLYTVFWIIGSIRDSNFEYINCPFDFMVVNQCNCTRHKRSDSHAPFNELFVTKNNSHIPRALYKI